MKFESDSDCQKDNQYSRSDNYLVSVMFTPIMLLCKGLLVWENNASDSIKSCFPIELDVEKEIAQLTQKIINF